MRRAIVSFLLLSAMVYCPLYSQHQLPSGATLTAEWHSPERPDYSVTFKWVTSDLQLGNSTSTLFIVPLRTGTATVGGMKAITVSSDTFRVTPACAVLRFNRLIQSVPSPAELSDAPEVAAADPYLSRGLIYTSASLVDARTGETLAKGIDVAHIHRFKGYGIPDTSAERDVVADLSRFSGRSVFLRFCVITSYHSYGDCNSVITFQPRGIASMEAVSRPADENVQLK